MKLLQLTIALILLMIGILKIIASLLLSACNRLDKQIDNIFDHWL